MRLCTCGCAKLKVQSPGNVLSVKQALLELHIQEHRYNLTQGLLKKMHMKKAIK
jgi:hypothetical protein